jgi:hypothetical protein
MVARNRVTPRSQIEAVPLRGLFMGNRGCLHRDREIVRNHQGKRWIICATDFNGRRVEQWADGRYTPLFFHDEAVALAAGHRPCRQCRFDRYEAYADAWENAFGSRPTAGEMDERLHAERLDGSEQRTTSADWSSLPVGAFALVDHTPALVLADTVVPWRASGYGTPTVRPSSGAVTVLTPPASVAVLAAGYEPVVSPST